MIYADPLHGPCTGECNPDKTLKQYKQAFPINFLLFMPDIIFYRLCCSLAEITDRLEMGRFNKNEFFLRPHSPASSNSRTLSSRNQIKALALCQLLFTFDLLLRGVRKGTCFQSMDLVIKIAGLFDNLISLKFHFIISG